MYGFPTAKITLNTVTLNVGLRIRCWSIEILLVTIMTSTRGESYLWRGSYEQKQRGEEERIFDCPLFLHWMISFRVYYTRCVAVRVLARSLSRVPCSTVR